MTVLPVYYFPPVSWFAMAMREKRFWLDQHQHFRKQGYFNRACIQGANKVIALSIPVCRTGRTPLHESRISYAEDWQQVHWKGIVSAYRNSPFFDYYEDGLRPFFQSRTPSLLTHNLALLQVLCGFLDWAPEWNLTSAYLPASHWELDLRESFDPGHRGNVPGFRAIPYAQVFRNFETDLSVLDLLCNEGPAAAQIIRESVSDPGREA